MDTCPDERAEPIIKATLPVIHSNTTLTTMEETIEANERALSVNSYEETDDDDECRRSEVSEETVLTYTMDETLKKNEAAISPNSWECPPPIMDTIQSTQVTFTSYPRRVDFNNGENLSPTIEHSYSGAVTGPVRLDASETTMDETTL